MLNGKRRTVPNSAISLQEMLRRFIRREPLPVEKQGVYVEGQYDLEKIGSLDRVEQDELLSVLRSDTAVKKQKVDDYYKAKEEEAIAAKILAKQQSDPKEVLPPKQP